MGRKLASGYSNLQWDTKNNLYIGAGRDVGFNKSLYMGFIDEVRIYNYGLTASEIQITNIENNIHGVENNAFQLYPNPTKDAVNIVYLLTPEKGTKIEIIDENGRIKYKQWAESETNRIETRKLTPGMYFIRSMNNQNSLIKKLIIQ